MLFQQSEKQDLTNLSNRAIVNREGEISNPTTTPIPIDRRSAMVGEATLYHRKICTILDTNVLQTLENVIDIMRKLKAINVSGEITITIKNGKAVMVEGPDKRRIE
jgi:hypothetical protein